jgi:hypothetical protein
MFGILVAICIYLVLGFMLAWVAGIVAKEDVAPVTGATVLFLAGLISMGIKYVLAEQVDGESARLGLGVIVDLAVLTLMIRLIARLNWKHSAIIAAIYSVLILVVVMGLASCA